MGAFEATVQATKYLGLELPIKYLLRYKVLNADLQNAGI